MGTNMTDSMIERVARILNAFRTGESNLSASELSRRTDIPLASTHRIVTEMVRVGLLQRNSSRLLSIGLKLWKIGTRAESASTLRILALPYMEDLNSVVQQHVQLSILDQDQILCIERLSSRRATIPNILLPGGHLTVLSSAAGLVLVAFAPEDVQEHLIASPVPQFTKETVMDRAEMSRLIAQTRKQGYAHNRAWVDPRTAGIAVPLVGPDGIAYAALSLIIPSEQVEVSNHVAALRTAANGIMRIVQSGGPPSDAQTAMVRANIRRSVNHYYTDDFDLDGNMLNG